MLTESDRLTRLVQQIIELSRLQGDDPLEAPVDGRRRRGGRRGRRHQRHRRRRQADRASSPAASPGSRSSATREQVAAAVGNLVANAVAYSGRGLHGRGLGQGRRTSTVEISVIDQGIGIPPGEIDRIFERFYRVDPARHRSTGGTGLGLSIVKHVAATHGGEVTVWSVEGQGSTFTLTLPRGGRPCDRIPVQPRAPTTSRRQRRDPSARRRGRGELQRRPRLHAPQGGLRGRDRGRPGPTRSPSSTATAPTSCCST